MTVKQHQAAVQRWPTSHQRGQKHASGTATKHKKKWSIKSVFSSQRQRKCDTARIGCWVPCFGRRMMGQTNITQTLLCILCEASSVNNNKRNKGLELLILTANNQLIYLSAETSLYVNSHVARLFTTVLVSSSASALLVGSKEVHPACKNSPI